MTRVLIADDHPLMLSGIEAVLAGTTFEVVAKAHDGAAALDEIGRSRPDIVILDIAMPVRSGMDVLRAMRSRHDQRAVVLLTAELGDSDLLEAFDLKVQGILPKNGADMLLLACLTEVARGGQWIERSILQRALSLAKNGGSRGNLLLRLTAREQAIAALVARGLRNREIGDELGITEGTVKIKLHKIFGKLQVENRVGLAVMINASQH